MNEHGTTWFYYLHTGEWNLKPDPITFDAAPSDILSGFQDMEAPRRLTSCCYGHHSPIVTAMRVTNAAAPRVTITNRWIGCLDREWWTVNTSHIHFFLKKSPLLLFSETIEGKFFHSEWPWNIFKLCIIYMYNTFNRPSTSVDLVFLDYIYKYFFIQEVKK